MWLLHFSLDVVVIDLQMADLAVVAVSACSVLCLALETKLACTDLILF